MVAGQRVLHVKADAVRRRTQFIGPKGDSYGIFLGVPRRNIDTIMPSKEFI
jgi:hypothetical protein